MSRGICQVELYGTAYKHSVFADDALLWFLLHLTHRESEATLGNQVLEAGIAFVEPWRHVLGAVQEGHRPRLRRFHHPPFGGQWTRN